MFVYLELLIALNQFTLDCMSALPGCSETSLPHLHSSQAEEKCGLCDHGHWERDSTIQIENGFNCCLHFLDNCSPFVMFCFVK